MKLKGVDTIFQNHAGNDIFSEIVRRGLIRVLDQPLADRGGLEQVNAHRDEGMRGIVRHRRGLRRLLVESEDTVILVDADDAEPARLREREFDRADNRIRIFLFEEFDHFRIVHLVDMIAGQDQ